MPIIHDALHLTIQPLPGPAPWTWNPPANGQASSLCTWDLTVQGSPGSASDSSCCSHWVYTNVLVDVFRPFVRVAPSITIRHFSLLGPSHTDGKRRFKQQDCIPVGCVPPARWPYLPTCPGLGLLQGGGGRGAWSRGGCLVPGGVVSQHSLRQTPPLWTEFLTHVYENITLPQTSFAAGKNLLLFMQQLKINSTLKWSRTCLIATSIWHIIRPVWSNLKDRTLYWADIIQLALG